MERQSQSVSMVCYPTITEIHLTLCCSFIYL